MINVNGGKKIPWHEGMTVAKLLEMMDDPYPFVVVRINNTLVSKPNFENYCIPDHSDIFLIPLIAGG